MINKTKLWEDNKFRQLIIEAIYIYKFTENAETSAEYNKRDAFNLTVREFLLANKYVNKDVGYFSIAIHKKNSNDLNEGVNISLQEQINGKWFYTSIILRKDDFKEWKQS